MKDTDQKEIAPISHNNKILKELFDIWMLNKNLSIEVVVKNK